MGGKWQSIPTTYIRGIVKEDVQDHQRHSGTGPATVRLRLDDRHKHQNVKFCLIVGKRE